MELPFEAAKGAVEKGLLVRFPIFMRVVLPGALASAVLYPTVAWLLGRLPANAEQIWQRFAAFAVCVFVIGALISTLTSEIYKIYEGRIFWPDRLLRWGERLQEARLRRFRQKAETARRAGDTARYDEAWYQLRLYPINEQGEPYVYRPTLLGNILAGYEQYPDNRYGMDSVFYWPRIWLQMEKEKKEAIDSQWSVADGFLLLSAICLAAACSGWLSPLRRWRACGGSRRLPAGPDGRPWPRWAGGSPAMASIASRCLSTAKTASSSKPFSICTAPASGRLPTCARRKSRPGMPPGRTCNTCAWSVPIARV